MKKKWILFSLIGFIFISMFIYFYFKSEVVNAIKIKKDNYTEKILVTGTIQAKTFSILTSGINGVIENIYAREGETINKGDIIAKLDTQEIEADILKAKANYEKAKYDFEVINTLNLENAKAELKTAFLNYDIAKSEYLKFKNLFQKKYISKFDYDSKKQAFSNAETALKSAQLNLNTFTKDGASNKSALENIKSSEFALLSLQKNLLKYYIYAPYDGFITTRNVEIGQTVSPYTDMFEVSAKGEKIVSIDLDEKYANRISSSSLIKVYPYADTTKFSSGNLYYVGINVDNSSGTLEARGKIDTILPEFLFNSTVNTIIEGKNFKDAILLENIYTIQKKNQIFVYILKDNKSKLIEIEGVPVIDGFIVTKGLEDNDIVLSPKNLKENMRIKPKFETN